MYSQSLIDTIGEEWAKSVLDGKTKYNFDINNINANDQRRYYCFQHFLVKAWINGYNKQACARYLNQMYDDFSKKPFLFYDSPLLKNPNISKIVDSSKQKSVTDFRNNYYSAEEFNRLLKIDRNKMTDEDKRKFYAILLLKLNSKNNSKYKKVFENEIEYILNSDYKSLTRMQLTFYAQYVSNWANRHSKVHTVAKVGKNPASNRGSCALNYVFINQKAFDSIAIMTKTICHENRHANQHYNAKNGDKTIGYEMAVHDLFSKYLSTESYDYYHTNYRYSKIELDAEKSGYWEASVFFNLFNRKDLSDEVAQERKTRLDKRNYYASMRNSDGSNEYIENFIIENLSKIIKEHPEEIKNYPVLATFFLPNGQIKPFKEILLSRSGKYSFEAKMYNEFIDYGICHGHLDKTPIHKMNSKELEAYLKVLKGTHHRDINLFLDYYRDTPKGKDSDYRKQIEMTSKHALYPVFKILKYLSENYEVLCQRVGNEKALSIFEDVVYYVRELSDQKIKNEIIKASPEANKALTLTRKKYIELVRKVNTTYMQEKLKEIPADILNTTIVTPNSKRMSLGQFLLNEAPKDSEQFNHYIVNGQSYYRSELVDYYLKKIKDRSSIEEEEHKKSK